VVSPQNQYIDVYGVIMAPAVYRLGEILKREDLKRMGILMFRSSGQIVDPYGTRGVDRLLDHGALPQRRCAIRGTEGERLAVNRAAR
jgi:hypothetical protein